MKEHLNRNGNNSGYTIIELMAVLSIGAVLTYTAIINQWQLRKSASRVAAQSDYRHVKTGIYAIDADPESVTTFDIETQLGPGPLPPPLDKISLSKNIQLDYARRSEVTFTEGEGDSARTITAYLTQYQLRTAVARRIFRYWDRNGEVVEQEIAY